MAKLKKSVDKKHGNEKICRSFVHWVDSIMEEDIPHIAEAVNFNIYEGSENTYDIELIAASEYDESDEDWVCDEVFTTRDNLFYIPRTSEIAEWKKGRDFVCALIKHYLDIGKNKDKLKSYRAVCAGFVDGNIEIVYKL